MKHSILLTLMAVLCLFAMSHDRVLNKAHFMHYRQQSASVRSKGLRIIGPAGGESHWDENSRGIYFTSITDLAVYPPLNE